MDDKRRTKMPRHDDRDDYARTARRGDTRDVREERTTVYGRAERRPVERDPRDVIMDDRMDLTRDPRDIRDTRLEPRANAAARLEPRRDRVVDPRADLDVYQDPSPGEYYQREPPSRAQYTRDEPRYETSSGGRRVIEPVTRETSEKYNDYFVPGDGIDREVIQNEITRFLGQDATCRPAEYKGKPGYMIKAYRALTSEMIRSLKEETLRFNREREKRQRSGRSTISYNAYQSATRPEVEAPQYRDEEMMDVDEESRYARDYPRDRDIRDLRDPRDLRDRDLARDPRGDPRIVREVRDLRDPRDPRDQRDPRDLRGERDIRDIRDIDMRDRDPRMVVAGRLPVVTSGYAPDTGYPAYVTSPAGPYVPESQPRTMYISGGNTPPASGRIPQGNYSQAGYPPPRTGVSAPPTTTSAGYREVLYPPETGRHRDTGRR